MGTTSVQGWGPVPFKLPLGPHLPVYLTPRLPAGPLLLLLLQLPAAKTEVDRRARKHFSFFFFLSLFLNRARMSLQQPCWCKINK